MEKTRVLSLTEGPILSSLIRFTLPILGALFLQAMYGAVDLAVVGHFAEKADVSAVSTGSQIMTTVIEIVSAFAVGTTVLLGQKIGQGRSREGGEIIGASLWLYGIITIALTLCFAFLSKAAAVWMHAPAAALGPTAAYVRICGVGSVVMILYNFIGAVFRGLGDSRTPLITVAIACVFNIAGDLLLVAVFHLGAAGAADYLKAYGIDCLLTCFLFCFIGFFDGMARTRFVMIQGVASAFGVRVPVSYLMSKLQPVSLFHIGLAVPISTLFQMMLVLIYYAWLKRQIHLNPEAFL